MAAPREQPDSCAAPDADKCPYQGGDRGAPHPLHGAAQQVNPSNLMPALPQSPAPGQQSPLPTRRIRSNIPKGDFTPAHQAAGSDNWVYPSQQQFFNAMLRKGWSPREEDMPQVVAIHNTVNERTWAEVRKWEAILQPSCEPKLLRFEGRPRDLSPKARVRTWMGQAAPFDRHDWVVERCGRQVRYVIDFYTGSQAPDRPATLSVFLDVRPAMDSVDGVLARLVWGPLARMRERFGRAAPSQPAPAPAPESARQNDSSKR